MLTWLPFQWKSRFARVTRLSPVAGEHCQLHHRHCSRCRCRHCQCSLSCDFVIFITFIIIMITIAHITPSSSLHLYLWVWVKLLWHPLESCLLYLNADSDRNSNAVTLIDIEWIKSAKWSVIDAWKLIIDRPGGEVDTFQEAVQVKWGDMEFIHVFLIVFFFYIFFTHFKRQCMSNGEAVEFLQGRHRCWLWRVWNEGTWDLNFLQNLVPLWISCNSVLFLQLSVKTCLFQFRPLCTAWVAWLRCLILSSRQNSQKIGT